MINSFLFRIALHCIVFGLVWVANKISISENNPIKICLWHFNCVYWFQIFSFTFGTLSEYYYFLLFTLTLFLHKFKSDYSRIYSIYIIPLLNGKLSECWWWTFFFNLHNKPFDKYHLKSRKMTIFRWIILQLAKECRRTRHFYSLPEFVYIYIFFEMDKI